MGEEEQILDKVESKSSNDLIERPADLEVRRKQELTLSNLEKQGILTIERDERGDLTQVVLDPEVFTQPTIETTSGPKLLKEVVKSASQSLTNANISGRNTRERLYWTFKGIPVVSPQEKQRAAEENQDPVPRNLFYVPREADIFDVKEMKKATGSYYLTQWSVGRNVHWDSPIATREGDYDSQTTLIEAAVPYEIYVTGKGSRDEGGTLWVQKNPKEPLGPRQKISGKWIRENFFSGGSKGDGSNWDSPTRMIQEKGINWEATGLLRESDFPVKNSEKTEFSSTAEGCVYINNKRFTLGNDYAGCRVVQLSPSEYGVYKDSDEPLLLFKDEIKSDSLRNCHVLKSSDRTEILVPLGAFPTSRGSEYGVVTVARYKNETRQTTTFRYEEEAPNLEMFKSQLAAGTLELFEENSLKDQILISRQISELSAENSQRAMDMLSYAGRGYMSYLSDIYKEGEIDQRVFDLDGKPKDEVKNLFDQYDQYRQSSLELVKTVEEGIHNKAEVESIFLERIQQSFLSRGQDFLILATEDNSIDEATELQELAESITAFSEALSTSDNTNFTHGISIDNTLTSVTKTTLHSNGKRSSLVVRPTSVPRHEDKRYDQGQARIGFQYRISNEKRIRIGIDVDEYGPSVDFGSRGDTVTAALARLGESHHTQRHFEQAFNNPIYFDSLVRKIPVGFDWKVKLPSSF